MTLPATGTLRRLVDPIARAWLAQGAAGVTINVQGSPVVTWPRGAEPSRPDLRANIASGRNSVAEIHVSGVDVAGAEMRLRSDAKLISSILGLESELSQMTAELSETQDQLVAVFDLARAARTRVDFDEILVTVVDVARDLTQARFAFILFDDSPGRIVTSPSDGFRPEEAVSAAFLTHVQASGRSLLANDSETLPDHLEMPDGVSSLIVVPITIEGRPRAALGVGRAGDHGFTAGSRKLLEAIGDQAGSLVESAIATQQTLARHRLQRDMELAAAVQRTLIARKLPSVTGLELAGRYRPAAEIGGDLYDVFTRNDGQLVVTVADVTGKGMPAALVMSMMRTAAHSVAAAMPGPDAALNRLNQDLYEELSDLSKFVTTFMAYYDPKERTVAIANCGHSPVVFCPAQGPARLIDANGPPIGVLDGDVTGSTIERLGPGDILAIGTDGISEAQAPDGTLFGYDRLMELIEGVRFESAAQLADAIFVHVDRFANGAAQADDQALVVLKGVAE